MSTNDQPPGGTPDSPPDTKHGDGRQLADPSVSKGAGGGADATTPPAWRKPSDYISSFRTVGLGIFVAASLGVIGILLVYMPTDIPNYEILRSVELLLTLAGTAIIVALISNTNNPVIIVFGFLLIGALIVPTNDIVRFALIASGSERRYEDFFVAPKSGKSQRFRDQDLASKILDSLEREPIWVPIDDEIRDLARSEIANILREEREATAVDQIRRRGVAPLLAVAIEGRIDEWIYRYGQDEKFKDDLNFLRSEGLITFVYDDYDTIQPTGLGRILHGRLQRSEEGQRAARVPSSPVAALGPHAASVPGPYPLPGEPLLLPEAEAEIAALGANPVSQPLGPEFDWFEIVPASEGWYRIDVSAESEFVDPYAILAAKRGDGRELDILAEDDDGGGGYSARIVARLNAGSTYYLAVYSISGSGSSRISWEAVERPSREEPVREEPQG